MELEFIFSSLIWIVAEPMIFRGRLLLTFSSEAFLSVSLSLLKVPKGPFSDPRLLLSREVRMTALFLAEGMSWMLVGESVPYTP